MILRGLPCNVSILWFYLDRFDMILLALMLDTRCLYMHFQYTAFLQNAQLSRSCFARMITQVTGPCAPAYVMGGSGCVMASLTIVLNSGHPTGVAPHPCPTKKLMVTSERRMS